jgi:hypothetical protein
MLLDISLLFFKLAANPAKYIDSPTYQYVSNASSPTVGGFSSDSFAAAAAAAAACSSASTAARQSAS